MQEIEISSIKEFRAFASDKRIQIIKLLSERNHTLSELSEKLELSNPTTKEHLEKLLEAKLIEQLNDGRKWKYYTLTSKGKKLIKAKEQQTSIVFIIASTSIALIVILALLFQTPLFQIGEISKAPNAIESQTASQAITEKPTSTAETWIATEKTAETEKNPMQRGIETSQSQLYAYAIALIVLAFILGYYTSIFREKKKWKKA